VRTLANLSFYGFAISAFSLVIYALVPSDTSFSGLGDDSTESTILEPRRVWICWISSGLSVANEIASLSTPSTPIRNDQKFEEPKNRRKKKKEKKKKENKEQEKQFNREKKISCLRKRKASGNPFPSFLNVQKQEYKTKRQTIRRSRRKKNIQCNSFVHKCTHTYIYIYIYIYIYMYACMHEREL